MKAKVTLFDRRNIDSILLKKKIIRYLNFVNFPELFLHCSVCMRYILSSIVLFGLLSFFLSIGYQNLETSFCLAESKCCHTL